MPLIATGLSHFLLAKSQQNPNPQPLGGAFSIFLDYVKVQKMSFITTAGPGGSYTPAERTCCIQQTSRHVPLCLG